MNNDNDLNLHVMTKLSGSLRYCMYSIVPMHSKITDSCIEKNSCCFLFSKENSQNKKQSSCEMFIVLKTSKNFLIENKAPSTRARVDLKPRKYFRGYAFRPHVTG